MMKHLMMLVILSATIACSTSQHKNAAPAQPPETKPFDFASYYKELDAEPVFAVCSRMEKSMASYHREQHSSEEAKQTHLKLVRKASVMPIVDYQSYVPEHRSFSLWTQTIGDVKYRHDPNYNLEVEKLRKGLERALPEAKRIDTHSYYSLILARLVTARPELSSRQDVQATCKFIETSVDRKYDSQLPVKMSALLKKVNVKPAEVQFDPNWKSKLRIDTLNDAWYRDTVWELTKG